VDKSKDMNKLTIEHAI